MYTIEIAKDKFWILEDAGVKRGLITHKNDDIYNIVIDGNSQDMSLADLHCMFDNKILTSSEPHTQTNASNNELLLNNFPCKHIPFNHKQVEWNNITIETYTKNETSKIRYAAGYFGLHFTGVWSKTQSPKLDTLEKYLFVGPFKTPDEAAATILIETRKK
jgi:hypothetical protein